LGVQYKLAKCRNFGIAKWSFEVEEESEKISVTDR